MLRAFVVKQLNPNDDTGIYHVFERLNTGGTQLVSQEIRNCVYHGAFNNLLGELNRLDDWRSIFGKSTEDTRQRDVELILRFFALSYGGSAYEKPMKDFLSRFMKREREAVDPRLEEFRTSFSRTAKAIHQYLGEKPFHVRAGLNAAVFDAVFVAFSSNLNLIPPDVRTRYDALTKNAEFLKSVSSGTTDNDVVQSRLRLARTALFG